MQATQEKLTILLSSDDFDKAFLAFMLGTGARSMGMDVNIYFALWGLNLLRRRRNQPGMPIDPEEKKKLKKGLIPRMMGMMMPTGPKRPPLSKMNMGGMGSFMMRGIMKSKGVQSLSELMNMAVELECRFTICSLTMELMGFHPDDLLELPNTSFGGVASCLGEATTSKMFIVV